MFLCFKNVIQVRTAVFVIIFSYITSLLCYYTLYSLTSLLLNVLWHKNVGLQLRRKQQSRRISDEFYQTLRTSQENSRKWQRAWNSSATTWKPYKGFLTLKKKFTTEQIFSSELQKNQHCAICEYKHKQSTNEIERATLPFKPWWRCICVVLITELTRFW